jgi:hypothetical protein
MDVLKITPPFFYSYQCGSTLLTSYLPVHMYSISFQVLSIIATLTIIFLSPKIAQHPSWLLSLFPGVCWPSHWQSDAGAAIDLDNKPLQLIKPHQLISQTMNNLILLLTFGLCSPVLCVYIAVSICLHLCSWLMLIGRFVSLRINALHASASSWPSTDRGSLVSSLLLAFICLRIVEEPIEEDNTVNDSLLHLLNQQLEGVNSSLMVCKWPVTLMSCFFVTLLSWDMAGDKGGWLRALWVPVVGVVMVLVIWICDHLLRTRGSWSAQLSHLRSSVLRPIDPPSSTSNPGHSLQLVRSLFHESSSAAAQGPPDVILDQHDMESK